MCGPPRPAGWHDRSDACGTVIRVPRGTWARGAGAGRAALGAPIRGEGVSCWEDGGGYRLFHVEPEQRVSPNPVAPFASSGTTLVTVPSAAEHAWRLVSRPVGVRVPRGAWSPSGSVPTPVLRRVRAIQRPTTVVREIQGRVFIDSTEAVARSALDGADVRQPTRSRRPSPGGAGWNPGTLRAAAGPSEQRGAGACARGLLSRLPAPLILPCRIAPHAVVAGGGAHSPADDRNGAPFGGPRARGGRAPARRVSFWVGTASARVGGRPARTTMVLLSGCADARGDV